MAAISDIVFGDSDEEYESEEQLDEADEEYESSDSENSSESEQSDEEKQEINEEEDIQFDSENEEETHEEETEDGNGGIDPNEFYEEGSKKIKKTFGNKRRIKPPKVSQLTKKKKSKLVRQTKEEIEFSDLRKKYSQILKKLSGDNTDGEKNIFNYFVRYTEKFLNRKVKRSDLSNDTIMSIYKKIFYESLIVLKRENLQKLIENLSQNKLGLYSDKFSKEKFLDYQETKNIEEPPKVIPGIHVCGKCVHNKDKKDDPDRGRRTTYYELQTRSQDEPMTQFIRCLDCGFNWKQ